MASRMKRKFSFDIPKLKIGNIANIGNIGNIGHMGSSRPDARTWKDQNASPPESRPSTPKSVRPPMPTDIEAALRAACSYIITHPKPSHEVWTEEAAKPALDYAAIKAGGVADAAPVLGVPLRTRSARHRAERSREPPHASKYAYKPHVATEDLFSSEGHPRGNARSRADMLMAGDAVKNGSGGRQRAGSASIAQSTLSTVRPEALDRPRLLQRSDSIRTAGSTPHTDSTDYPWSASTGLTSAVNSPALRSKRASGQAIVPVSDNESMPKVDAVEADWMRSELEKHRKAMEDKERLRPVDTANQSETTPTQHTTTSPPAYPQVPARKPVPSHPGSRQASHAISRPSTRQELRSESKDQPQPERGRPFGRTDSLQPDPELEATADTRGRAHVRSSSRVARASQAASRAASRAAQEAKSMTQDILGHYFHPHTGQDSREPIERPPSRARDIAHGMKDYFRPGTATGYRARKPSGEFTRGHARGHSFGSVQTSNSEAAPSEQSASWKRWRPLHRAPADTNGTSSDSVSSKTVIDLNRKLPPLPGLDSWKDNEPPQVPVPAPTVRPVEQPPRDLRSSPSLGAGLTPAYNGLRRALSRASMRSTPSPLLATKDEIIAARLGTPTPPRSQKHSVDVRSYDHLGDHPLPSPPIPAMYNRSATSSPVIDSLSATRSADRLSAHSSAHDSTRARLSRDSSALSQHSEKSSRFRRPHLADYRRGVGPPLSGSSRPWGRAGTGQRPAGTTASTPHGHSRDNSDRSHATSARGTDRAHIEDPHYTGSAEGGLSGEKGKKKHWWHLKEKRGGNWTEEVADSGARHRVAGAQVAQF